MVGDRIEKITDLVEDIALKNVTAFEGIQKIQIKVVVQIWRKNTPVNVNSVKTNATTKGE